MERAFVPGTLITDYVHRKVENPRELIVLLHGYDTRGETLLSKLVDALPADAAVLAPNGPYPLPQRQEDGNYRVGFAWYFYNFKTDEYFIDMENGVTLVKGLVEQCGYGALPKRVVGFSQGGYLAPRAALALSNVKQVIGIGCRFLDEELEHRLPFRLDLVHGELDEIIPQAEARRSHEVFRAAGTEGEFRFVPGIGHRVSPGMSKQVGELLLK